jgi:hypothetical protein
MERRLTHTAQKFVVVAIFGRLVSRHWVRSSGSPLRSLSPYQ